MNAISSKEPIQTVLPQVELMEGYLRMLLDEFELEVQKASLTQSLFEAHMAKAMQSPPLGLLDLKLCQRSAHEERLKGAASP